MSDRLAATLAGTLYFTTAIHALDLLERQPRRLRDELPRDFYLKSFCTLAIRGQRGSGHSTAAAYLKQSIGEEALVVTINDVMRRWFANNFGVEAVSVYEFQADPARFSQQNPKVIIVDAASGFTEDQTEMIYRFSRREDPFFIFLG